MHDDTESATWWDLARRLGVVRRLVVPLDPRVPRLEFDWMIVGPNAARWAHLTRRGLDRSGTLLDSMLKLSRGPVPRFPSLPEEFGPNVVTEFISAHACQRTLRADAVHRFEKGRHRVCVERIEAIAGLARHCLGQDQTMWVVKGAMFLQTVGQATRLLAYSVRRAHAERAALRLALARIEDLDPSPWPVLLKADVEARASIPEANWPDDVMGGRPGTNSVRQSPRSMRWTPMNRSRPPPKSARASP
jgi:hypothetical protein